MTAAASIAGTTSTGASRLSDLDDDQREALRKIEKLLRLAGSNPNPEEAASAARKAQDLLLAYNLDAAILGSGDDGRRAKEEMRGGFYEYQRDLLSRMADLNFCIYWTSRDWVERTEADRRCARTVVMRGKYRTHALRWRHHLVGRTVNILATTQMYSYIYQTTERLTREFLAPDLPRGDDDRIVGLNAAMRSRRATSFREGVAHSVAEKLWDRRSDQLAEERRRQAEGERRAAEARAAGLSSSTAVTISSLKQSEADANADFLHGEGWSARNRARIAAAAEARRRAEEEYTVWAAAHPEEAAKKERERVAEERRRERRWASRSWSGKAEKERDWAAHSAGREAGRDIGLDPQTSDQRQKRIGRSG